MSNHVNTQILRFSWRLNNRPDARAESHTYAKRTIIRKKLPTKSNIFAVNETENNYRLFSSDYQNWQTVKLVKKSVAVWGPWYLTQHRNLVVELYRFWIVSLLTKIFQTSILFETNKFHHRGSPCSGGPGQLLPLFPLIRPCMPADTPSLALPFSGLALPHHTWFLIMTWCPSSKLLLTPQSRVPQKRFQSGPALAKAGPAYAYKCSQLFLTLASLCIILQNQAYHCGQEQNI